MTEFVTGDSGPAGEDVSTDSQVASIDGDIDTETKTGITVPVI